MYTVFHRAGCPNCSFWYQLKGQKSRIGSSVADGAYGAMMNAIRTDETPNFYFMHYDLATWRIKNLLLIPSFAFPPSAIIKRKPLSVTARRAGWIGCNIALNRIPVEARIPVVKESVLISESDVRQQFRKVKPLSEIAVSQRGWTLDVLNIVRRMLKERGSVTRSSQPTTDRGSPKQIKIIFIGRAVVPRLSQNLNDSID